MLILFLFLNELFIHNFVNPFMHDLIEFSLFHIIELLHNIEILGECPKILSKLEPSS